MPNGSASPASPGPPMPQPSRPIASAIARAFRAAPSTPKRPMPARCSESWPRRAARASSATRQRWRRGRSSASRPVSEMLRLLSLALFIGTWVLGSWLAGDRMLPPPTAVAAAIVAEARSGELFWHLGITLARVALAFSLAMAVGTAIGFLMGRVSLADRIGDPWLIVLLNLPALVIIVLAYIWGGLTEAAAILAVAVNKVPNAVVVIRE